MGRDHEYLGSLVVERFGGTFGEIENNFRAALQERLLRVPEELPPLVVEARDRALAECSDTGQGSTPCHDARTRKRVG